MMFREESIDQVRLLVNEEVTRSSEKCASDVIGLDFQEPPSRIVVCARQRHILDAEVTVI